MQQTFSCCINAGGFLSPVEKYGTVQKFTFTIFFYAEVWKSFFGWGYSVFKISMRYLRNDINRNKYFQQRISISPWKYTLSLQKWPTVPSRWRRIVALKRIKPPVSFYRNLNFVGCWYKWQTDWASASCYDFDVIIGTAILISLKSSKESRKIEFSKSHWRSNGIR